MATHARREDKSEAVSIRNLQKHMTMMTAEFEKITRENSDLKSHLRQMSEDSTRKRDFTAVLAERDRYMKLSEHLKSEKSHLVESVLELSHEIDVLQRESSHSELQSVEKIRHFINMEKESLSARFQMEVQIMDALSAHGLSKDGILIKKIQSILKSTRGVQSPNTSMTPVDHIPPPRTETMMVGVCGSEYDDTKSPERLDAASLRAWNAEIAAQDALELGAVEPIKSNHNVGTGSVRSNGSRRKLSLYPGKSRGKDALARDETESVISSVSTHRSKKSLASISSWFSTSNGVPEIEKKPRKSGGGAITAANLAILNQMNYDVPLGKDFPRERPVRQSSKQAKTPKSVEANGENFWWPTIF